MKIKKKGNKQQATDNSLTASDCIQDESLLD